MKISSIVNPTSVERTSSRGKRAPVRDSPETSVSVRVSGDARWLADIKESAAGLDDVQTDQVAQAQQDLADGSLEQQVDWDAVLDALIMEL
ncbi:MAG: hypothetical protein ABIO70_16615 [Pseudomonadota bacterium]